MAARGSSELARSCYMKLTVDLLTVAPFRLETSSLDPELWDLDFQVVLSSGESPLTSSLGDSRTVMLGCRSWTLLEVCSMLLDDLLKEELLSDAPARSYPHLPFISPPGCLDPAESSRLWVFSL